jgi:hypothetical protein
MPWLMAERSPSGATTDDLAEVLDGAVEGVDAGGVDAVVVAEEDAHRSGMMTEPGADFKRGKRAVAQARPGSEPGGDVAEGAADLVLAGDLAVAHEDLSGADGGVDAFGVAA